MATNLPRGVEADSASGDGPYANGAMTVDAAVEWSGIGRTVLYMLMEKGTLPYKKHGKRRLISRRALAAYLTSLPEYDGSDVPGLHWAKQPRTRGTP